MGNPVSKIRHNLDHSEEEQREMKERLNVLEKMVNFRLENAKEQMIRGERGDQEIHTGTVVELNQQVNIDLSKQESPELEEAIKEFFSGHIVKGFEHIITLSVESVLGNASMGEHEGSSMFIVWSNNALLRLDAFYYRWNFSSNEVIQDVEGASGTIVMKRVIDITKTDPQVLTWAISRQAAVLGVPEQAGKMIDDAVEIIKKVSELQITLRSTEIEEESIGIGSKSGTA